MRNPDETLFLACYILHEENLGDLNFSFFGLSMLMTVGNKRSVIDYPGWLIYKVCLSLGILS